MHFVFSLVNVAWGCYRRDVEDTMAELTPEIIRALIREEITPLRIHTDGLPQLQHAIQILQRDVRQIRDDITVLTGISIRLEGAIGGLTIEMRGIRDHIGHLGERLLKLEDQP